MQSLQAVHDKLLEDKPDGVEHVEADCPFCTPQSSDNSGGYMSKTYSDEEVEALVTKAGKAEELQAELDAFKSSQSAAEVEAKIAEAKAESDAQVADLQAQLDAKVIEAEAASTAKNEILTWLEAESEKITKEAEATARTDERVAQVAEVASFPEDYIVANAARWAGMDDETFEATIADYKAVAEKAVADAAATKGVPSTTALHASREANGNGGSSAKEVIRLRETGFDPRELTR